MFVEICYRFSNHAVAKGRRDPRRLQLIAFSWRRWLTISSTGDCRKQELQIGAITLG